MSQAKKRGIHKMLINHSILHILDFSSGVRVFSQRELEIGNLSTKDFVEKHISHAQCDYRIQQGTFLKDSWFLSSLKSYIQSLIDFAKFSTLIAKSIYESIVECEKIGSTDIVDVLVVDFTQNDESYIAIFMLNGRQAYTHHVVKNEGFIQNEIVQHHAVLPVASQKLDSFAIINKRSAEIRISEKRKSINGKDVFVMKEKVLQCVSDPASVDLLKGITKIVSETVGDDKLNRTIAISKAKNFIIENSEISDFLSTEELGKEVFSESKALQNEYEELIQGAKLPKVIRVEKRLALRTGKNHKIKTDTGIEISFPAEYFGNSSFIKFINNSDGTISIELKNIGKIINK